MLTEDQLKAMEASAPLLVAEVRRLKAIATAATDTAPARESQAYVLGYAAGYEAGRSQAEQASAEQALGRWPDDAD